MQWRSSARLPYVLVAARLAVAGTPADAQRADAPLTIEIGAAHVTQAPLVSAGALTLSAGLRGRSGSTTGALDGTGVVSAGGGTLQTSGGVSTLFGGFSGSHLELGASASLFSSAEQMPVTTGQVFARHHYSTNTAGAYYGASAGRSAWNGASLPAASLHAGGWLNRATRRFGVNGVLTLTQSEYRTVTSSGETRTVFDVRYTDVSASFHEARQRATLDLVAGGRIEMTNATGGVWGVAAASYAVTPIVALVASAGRSPADIVRGVPESRFVTAGLRTTLGGARRPNAPAAEELALTSRVSGDTRVLTVNAKGARRVEVIADFTGWQPTAMSESAEGWTLTRSIAPGIYRVLVRVDGGAWRVPSNLVRGKDDLMGFVGLLTVL